MILTRRHTLPLLTLLILLTCLTGFSLAATSGDKLKVGFVFVSPVGDAGWTYQHNRGRLAMEKKLGDRVETKYIEKVPEGPEAERVIRNLAKSGYDLIFTTSFGYMNPTLKVARMFPEKYFEHATGYKTAKNMGTYMCRYYEGRYLSGIIAGKMSRSNILGYIAAFPIPEVIRGINAYTLGAQSVNPDIKVKVIWINSWFDPGKEREASEALITQGADVLTHHTDSTATVLTAEKNGVYAIAYHSDMSKYGPKSQLTAVTHTYGDYYTRVAQSVLDQTWKPEVVWSGIKEGSIKLAQINPIVPKQVVARVKKAERGIADGSFHPFHGPINNQEGKLVVAAGKKLTDKDLLEMNYYVQGVQGNIPK